MTELTELTKPAKPVLAITHLRTKNPGRFQPILRRLGHELTFCCPGEGETLPPDLTPYAGVLSLGGPMSVNDGDPAIRREIEWLEQRVLPAGIPFLGACLGAQILARTLGGTVARHPQEQVEAGYYRIRPARDGCAFFPARLYVYAFHEDYFSLPPGAALLAQGSKEFPVQAFRYGNAFGFQFHAEATLAMRRVWIRRTGRRLQQKGAQTHLRHYALAPLLDPLIASWTKKFLRQWLAV